MLSGMKDVVMGCFITLATLKATKCYQSIRISQASLKLANPMFSELTLSMMQVKASFLINQLL